MTPSYINGKVHDLFMFICLVGYFPLFRRRNAQMCHIFYCKDNLIGLNILVVLWRNCHYFFGILNAAPKFSVEQMYVVQRAF